MHYGILVPNFGDYGEAAVVVDLAREAETAGWDGFFIWDHLQFYDPSQPVPVTDAWTVLVAIAASTSRIRFGPLVTPLPRRRPWKVARETVTLDRLSNGRLILGVGLGEPTETDFAWFGEQSDPPVRAEMLDEALSILTGLWSGRPFSFEGRHFQLPETIFQPTPIQSPRIPIWVGGWWPNRRPMRRAARWDGVVPLQLSSGGFGMLSPAELQEIVAYVRAHRTETGDYDVVVTGETPGQDPEAAGAIVTPYVGAGLTWWVESLHGLRGSLEAMRERIRQGPPLRPAR